jgi:hypothetical protein
MKTLLLAASAIVGLTGSASAAAAELDLNDRPAMMQLADDLLRCVITFNFMALKAPEGALRTAREKDAADYSIATLHLYKLLKVHDDEALARARWNAMFEHVKWAEAQDALDVEMKVCAHIEPLQRELVALWQREQPSEGE